MTGNHRFFRGLLIVILALALCAGSAAAESLADVQAALADASGIDEQLGILYNASFRFSGELETAGWDVSLTCAPAGDLPEDLKVSTDRILEMEKTDLSVQDLEGAKIICLYNDKGTLRLLGDYQVRIPEALRAASVEEADTVLYMLHYTTSRSDYIGSAYNRHYDAYVFRRGENTCCAASRVTTTPPVSGYGTLSGETVAMSDLWNGTRPWFYGTMEISYPEGTATYRITGSTCCLAGLEGEFTRFEIPESVNGYPVTGIEYCGCETLEELILPEGIVWIQCVYGSKLKTMNFPSTLRRITSGIPTYLNNLILNEGLEEIGDFAVLYADGEDFFLPSTLKSVGRGTLEYGVKCPVIIIPEGMTALPDYFLMGADSLVAVYIPAGVTSFGSDLLNYGNCRIYTPEDSRAASWAKGKGYEWTPCESAEAMPPVTAGEENGFRYVLLGGEAVLTGYTGSEEDVRVPETLGGCPVTSVHCETFDRNNLIRSIALPETVTVLRNECIYNCYGLKTLYLPASVTRHGLSSYWQTYHTAPESTVYLAEGSPIAEEWSGSEDMRWAVWEDGAEALPQEEPFAWSEEQLTALRTPGETVTFGNWELNENEADGPEPVEWTVLAAEDGRSLLVTKNALTERRFDDATNHPTFMSWSSSDIRVWLQTECIDTLFSRAERTMILSVEHGTLSEKIFFLSTEEVRTLFASDEDRICMLYKDGEECPGSWWLRTAGTSEKHSNVLANVQSDGTVNDVGANYGVFKLIRPAVWVRTD